MPSTPASRRANRKKQNLMNTHRMPKKIEIIDKKCADHYFINFRDFEYYRDAYMRMPDIHILADGLILK